MSEKMTAIERLEALLDEKEREREETEERAVRAERGLERRENGEPWECLYPKTSAEEEGLPVPRLEIRWRKENDWTWIAEYSLVYRHFLGEFIRIPFSVTKVSGSDSREVCVRADGSVETPFRDHTHIRHDMRHLNLPGYAISGKHVTKLEPLDRPAPYEEAPRS